jgi:hypothetical protein
MSRSFSIFVWACLLLGSLASVVRAGVTPGTSIDNQAGANYVSAAGLATTSLSNTIHVVTVAGPVQANLTLTKTVSTTTAGPGDPIAFTLTAANVGTGDAAPVTVAIDGTNVNKIVVRDTIPDNTKFASFSTLGGSTPLYHLYGAAAANYVSAAPSDLSTVDAVAFALGAFPSGATASFSFSVTLNSNATGTISNTAIVYFNNGSNAVTTSNTVVVTAKGPAPTIGFFTTGGFSRPAPVGSAGQPLFIQANAGHRPDHGECSAFRRHRNVYRHRNRTEYRAFPSPSRPAYPGCFRQSCRSRERDHGSPEWRHGNCRAERLRLGSGECESAD